MPALSTEVQYVLLLVGLFVLPRILQRVRLPSAVTCVAIGAVAGIGLHAFHDDTAIPLLATLGIVSLFLFAGLEVDVREMRRGASVLAQHVGIQLVLLAAGAAVCHFTFDVEIRTAVLISLAVLTPSTGFILDSLPSFGLNEHEQFWVRSKAIATELVALVALFITVQSRSASALTTSSIALLIMIVLLPPIFRAFARIIAPFAPKTEFTFLLITALVCAFITRQLGAYYLVGAFVVGVAAVQLRHELPQLTSQRLLGAMELFAGFFIPFYFFKAGLHLEKEHFSLEAVGLGLAMAAIVVPMRIAIVTAHRWFVVDEPFRASARIGLAMVPTLVFTLVLAAILREQFALSSTIFGGLMVFALVNTVIPGLILRIPPPEFGQPDVDDNQTPPGAEGSGAEGSPDSSAAPATDGAMTTGAKTPDA